MKLLHGTFCKITGHATYIIKHYVSLFTVTIITESIQHHRKRYANSPSQAFIGCASAWVFFAISSTVTDKKLWLHIMYHYSAYPLYLSCQSLYYGEIKNNTEVKITYTFSYSLKCLHACCGWTNWRMYRNGPITFNLDLRHYNLMRK